MTQDQTKRMSAIATNAVNLALDSIGRVILTDADADIRDSIFDLLMKLQKLEAEPQSKDGSISLVAANQSKPDLTVDKVRELLTGREEIPERVERQFLPI